MANRALYNMLYHKHKGRVVMHKTDRDLIEPRYVLLIASFSASRSRLAHLVLDDSFYFGRCLIKFATTSNCKLFCGRHHITHRVENASAHFTIGEQMFSGSIQR